MKDLRFALRFLARRPGFSAVVIVSLALAIGANTAIFSLVNAVLLGSVPVHDPDRVLAIYTKDQKNPGYLPVSDLNARDIAEQGSELLEATRFTFAQAEISDGDTAFGIGGIVVAANYFDVLGVEPAIGRTFDHDDNELGGHPEVVLAHDIWLEKFGGDPDILGRTLRFNEAALTVVGVAPEGFGGIAMFRAGFFAPYSVHRELAPASQFFGERRFLAFNALARLRDGVSIEQANAELERIGLHLEQEYPVENEGRSFNAVPLAHAVVGPDQRDVLVTASALMMTIVGFVLLIACANAANLMLARAASRRSEMAIRQVLGATSTRLLRQLLTESLVLSGIAGILGLLLAWPLQGVLWELRPAGMNFSGLEPHIDAKVLLFTVGATIGTGVLFGLVPALRSTRVDLITPLKEETTPVTGSGTRFGLRTILVVAQVALSMIALVGAGLFIRSMENARNVDPGFRTSDLVMADVDLRKAASDPALLTARARELRLAVEALPEVEAAGFATRDLLSPGLMRTTYVEGSDADAEDGVLFNVASVSPGYFDAIGQAVLDGRAVEDGDTHDKQRVVVVNDAFARRFWPDGDATGHGITFMGAGPPLTIVGIVATTKVVSPTEDPLPILYIPIAQWPEPMSVMHVHTTDPEGVGSAIERVVGELGDDIKVANFRRVEAQLDAAVFAQRTAAMLLGAFGLLALGLAFIGIYGVMSYTVRQRTREIGIRMALGARPRDVLRWVMLQAMSAVVLGVGLGIAGGLVLQRLLSTLLFEVPTADIWAYGGAAGVLISVALVAGWLPARHATRINPNAAIHHE